MNELQRQQYLDALGIDSYMPRWVLPVAPAPVACQPVVSPAENRGAAPLVSAGEAAQVGADVAVAPPEHDVAPAEPASSAVQPTAGARQVLAAVEEIAGASRPASAVPDRQDTPAGQASTEPKDVAGVEAPRFALSVWHINESLMVIDSRQAELALPTEPLLNNILQALGFPRQRLPRAEVMRWPMFDNRLAPQGEEAARETVMAMLEAWLEQQPATYLLLMGADACHYVLPPESGQIQTRTERYSAASGKVHDLNPLACKAIVVPSLCDMLQDTALKAACWHAIQPLRQR